MVTIDFFTGLGCLTVIALRTGASPAFVGAIGMGHHDTA